METFVIRRRSAWKNAAELEAAAGVSLRVGNDEMSDRIRWIRSYVVSEEERASEAASDRPAKGKPSKGQSRRRR